MSSNLQDTATAPVSAVPGERRVLQKHTLKTLYTLKAMGQDPMQRLLILGVLALVPSGSDAKPPAIQCPGENTIQMRYCAEKSWEQSDAQLRQKVGRQLMEQWHEATKALCSAAYDPYKDGTIYPQLVLGCDDRLNRAMLKEFKRMDEQ